jgi:hypothetical protein
MQYCGSGSATSKIFYRQTDFYSFVTSLLSLNTDVNVTLVSSVRYAKKKKKIKNKNIKEEIILVELWKSPAEKSRIRIRNSEV